MQKKFVEFTKVESKNYRNHILYSLKQKKKFTQVVSKFEIIRTLIFLN